LQPIAYRLIGDVMIAVIGRNGQLGWELVRQGKSSGLEMLALGSADIDVTSPQSIDGCLERRAVQLVINAAAFTAVDRAETENKRAFEVNRDGPANLADFCARAAIPFIHVSTDYVFDGSKAGAYREDDPVSPIGIYGQSKAAGETEVRRKAPEHLIVRTAWLYGVHGHNFVKTMLRLRREKKPIRVVDDQTGCPTYAAELALTILLITDHILAGKKTRWGTYHYCGAGSVTWFGFAKAVFEIAGQYETFAATKVIPISSAEYATPAKRPANSVLDCSKVEKHFGIQPRPWIDSLTEMIGALYGSSKKSQSQVQG
jgi:dTDP-4-dehydrorhamnose reductase